MQIYLSLKFNLQAHWKTSNDAFITWFFLFKAKIDLFAVRRCDALCVIIFKTNMKYTENSGSSWLFPFFDVKLYAVAIYIFSGSSVIKNRGGSL